MGGGSEGGVGWRGGMDFAKSPRARAARARGEAQNGTFSDFPHKPVGLATLFWHHHPETQNRAPAPFGGYIRRKK